MQQHQLGLLSTSNNVTLFIDDDEDTEPDTPPLNWRKDSRFLMFHEVQEPEKLINIDDLPTTAKEEYLTAYEKKLAKDYNAFKLEQERFEGQRNLLKTQVEELQKQLSDTEFDKREAEEKLTSLKSRYQYLDNEHKSYVEYIDKARNMMLRIMYEAQQSMKEQECCVALAAFQNLKDPKNIVEYDPEEICILCQDGFSHKSSVVKLTVCCKAKFHLSCTYNKNLQSIDKFYLETTIEALIKCMAEYEEKRCYHCRKTTTSDLYGPPLVAVCRKKRTATTTTATTTTDAMPLKKRTSIFENKPN